MKTEVLHTYAPVYPYTSLSIPVSLPIFTCFHSTKLNEDQYEKSPALVSFYSINPVTIVAG